MEIVNNNIRIDEFFAFGLFINNVHFEVFYNYSCIDFNFYAVFRWPLNDGCCCALSSGAKER